MTMILNESPSEFVFQTPSSSLSIERISGKVSSPAASKSLAEVNPDQSRGIVGILGLVDLPYSKYLIIATKCELAGYLLGNEVYKITSTNVLRVVVGTKDDAKYVNLLKQHLNNASLYFSPTTDLTTNQQKRSLQRGPDERFLWNYEITREIASYTEFVFPVLYGIFSEKTCSLNNHSIQLSVISRRSRFRAGTRYFRRGLDGDGHAANYNETEQVIWIDKKEIFSYIQTRGSVPAYWGEVNTLKYRPKLQIGNISDSIVAARNHFKEQKEIYGPQILVNLVNQSGYEKPVKDIYEQVVSELKDKDIQYVYFDFHKECSHMRWNRVKLLMDQLEECGLYDLGWFNESGGEVKEEQNGVIRTNCMDCLDRTNVVQSTIALNMVERQLQTANVIPLKLDVTGYPEFMQMFRNMWADNADGVSCAYSGTGALKTDFTRTGKRTKWGALDDFVNSALRYYRNNLRDGPRQDGFSLFLGDYIPHARAHPFLDHRPLLIQSMPYAFAGSTIVTFLSILYPSQNHSLLVDMIMTLIFAATAVFTIKFVFDNGLQYVNWPKLTPVEFVQWTGSKYIISGGYSTSKEE